MMMRARTGKAVTLMAVPRKSLNVSAGTATVTPEARVMVECDAWRWPPRAYTPSRNGVATLPRAMIAARPDVFFILSRSTSSPTAKMNTTMPS